MNALLSMGNITGTTITVPSQEMEPLPKTWQKFFENVGQLMAHIKTYDQTVYETTVDEDSIKIRL